MKLFKLLYPIKNLYWHATSNYEKNQIKKFFNSKNISVAPNISVNPNKKSFKNKYKFLDLFFIGRIAKMKNLIFTLEALKVCSFKIKFTIYGPIDDFSYWQKCKKIINDLPKNIIVVYKGSVVNSDIENIIKKHNFFISSTFGENFGHSIAESLANSTPVVISDKTPWQSLHKFNAGWNFSLNNKKQLVELLIKLNEMKQCEYKTTQNSSLNYYIDKHEDLYKKHIITYYKLFNV